MATVQPSNNSELQLYRVLQRANLLQYFETFITQGGDDVQQLCEAGEDEFLEIMALVGMASKPLHVRRLQKALQEWVANPAAFEASKKYPTHVMSISASSGQTASPSHSLERSSNLQDYKVTPSQSSTISTSTPWSSQVRDASPSDGSNLDDPSSSNSPQTDLRDMTKDVLYGQSDSSYSSLLGVSQPVLLEHQITAIAAAAAILAQELPNFEPKSMPKKQISKDIQKVMLMSPDDPCRMDAMRRYAAIYGRFDSKRKNHRPMSLHEISVNEAAAQLCSHIPALLTRRDDLFPLARQVVRDSGYQYSKGHSRYEEPGAAEVLMQPRLEEGEAVPSTSSVISSPLNHEDSFNDLQLELTQLTLELTELAKEQNRIRSALRVLLEMNDHDQMRSLTAEMDVLNDRQTVMTKRRQRIMNTIARYRNVGSSFSAPSGCVSKHSPKDSSALSLPLMKPGNISGKFSGNGYGDETQPNNPLNTLYMAAVQNQKDSLFEEGLRIATQYGMSDFAQEIIGMKSTKEEVDVKKDLSPRGNSGLTGESVTSSSAYVVGGSGKCMQLLPSPSTNFSPAVGADIGVIHVSKSSSGRAKICSDKHASHIHSVKNVASLSSPEASNDESTDGSNIDDIYSAGKINAGSDKQIIPTAAGESSLQGSTTTTTTITKKSGQVMEVETRRSSRRKNGEPDYYLINGGEKRFRNGNFKRSSSTSSERDRRLSSSSSSCFTPTAASPSKHQKLANQFDDDDSFPMDVSDHSGRIRTEVHKMASDVNQSNEDIDSSALNSRSGVTDDLDYDNEESDTASVKKKSRAPTLGLKLLTSVRDYK